MINGMKRAIGMLKGQIHFLRRPRQNVTHLNVVEREYETCTSMGDAVLREICENNAVVPSDNRRWSNQLISLAFVLYASSAKAYRFLKGIMPLPAVSLLYQRLVPRLHFLKDRLTATDGVGPICEAWRQQHGISPDETIDVILGCDAASFKPDEINNGRCAYCFAYLIMPLNPRFPACVCHLCPLESGALGEQEGMAACKRVVAELGQWKVRVVSVATDGGRSYATYQTSIFKVYAAYLDQPLEQLSNIAVNSPFWGPSGLPIHSTP
jgi:hypothetical protein